MLAQLTGEKWFMAALSSEPGRKGRAQSFGHALKQRGPVQGRSKLNRKPHETSPPPIQIYTVQTMWVIRRTRFCV
jgi:hypothetical protein